MRVDDDHRAASSHHELVNLAILMCEEFERMEGDVCVYQSDIAQERDGGRLRDRSDFRHCNRVEDCDGDIQNQVRSLM